MAALSGAPFPSGNINALAFDSGGRLFGINNNEDDPPLAHLVTINAATGVITDVGASVDDLDAITFQSANTHPAPALGKWGQILLAGLLVAAGVWTMHRRRAVP